MSTLSINLNGTSIKSAGSSTLYRLGGTVTGSLGVYNQDRVALGAMEGLSFTSVYSNLVLANVLGLGGMVRDKDDDYFLFGAGWGRLMVNGNGASASDSGLGVFLEISYFKHVSMGLNMVATFGDLNSSMAMLYAGATTGWF